jgi:peptide/nickel transport system permease protein
MVTSDADTTPPREGAAVRGALAGQAPGARHWWQGRAARRLVRHRLAMAGLVVLLFMCAMAVFSPVITGTDPNHGDLQMVRKPPQEGHWLGTDGAGRDVWARLVYASRISVSVGVISVAVATMIGVLLGSIAGYGGGMIDTVVMRFTDIILCFPTLLVILSVVTVVGPSVFNVMLVIGGFTWPGICRLVRGQFLSLREQDFILAARSIGASHRAIVARHLLPNVVAPVSVAVTLGLAGAILTEAGLSFLGLSVQVPTPTWGNMLLGATSISIIENNWWLWLPPGLMIAAAVLAINFVGDGLRDALDPRMRLD